MRSAIFALLIAALAVSVAGCHCCCGDLETAAPAVGVGGHAGCGEVYWHQWISDPPDICDPCDPCYGDWVGQRPCYPKYPLLQLLHSD